VDTVQEESMLVLEVVQGMVAVVQGMVEGALSVVHAECRAEVAVAEVVCPMLAMARDPTSRRPRTSTWVVVVISMS